jgi:hypothetical protein
MKSTKQFLAGLPVSQQATVLNLPARCRSWARFLGGVMVPACVLALSGCLSKPAMREQTFSFEAPVPAFTNTISSGRLLGIETPQIARPFDGRALVYRTGEFSYASDPYASFLGSPADALAAQAGALLLENGCFKDVVEAGTLSVVKPDTLLKINVSQLYGDLREQSNPRAVIALQMVFLNATNGLAGNVILLRDYSRQIPIKTSTPADLMAGWNKAMTEIFAEASSDFRNQESAQQARADQN